MMAWLWLDNGSHKLPPSASGFPSLRVEGCRWTPNRRISQIQEGVDGRLRACGRKFLHSGVHRSLIDTIAAVGLGIKSP